MGKLIAALALGIALTSCASAPARLQPEEKVVRPLTIRELRMLIWMLDPHRNPGRYPDQHQGRGVA